MKQLTILGATGSIGQSTLDIVALHPERYRLFALTANDNRGKMEALCRRFTPTYAVMNNGDSAQELQKLIII